MSSNPDIVNSLDIQGLLSRLDLSRGVAGTKMAEYEDLYPAGWAGDEKAETRHREAVRKITSWPRNKENMVSYLGRQIRQGDIITGILASMML